MKLIVIGLAIILFPIITWIAEWHESEWQMVRRDIQWLADHDRTTQAVQPMNRRMQYATIGCKQKSLRGRAAGVSQRVALDK